MTTSTSVTSSAKPVYESAGVTLYHGDSQIVLSELGDESIDSVVTDPPYGLVFMNKNWDKPGVAYQADFWQEIFRVLKPGGHLLACGGSRTYHRMAVAIEDAGFEIRDSLMWVHALGFPKSHNISKAIDRMAGAEREVIGSKLGLPGYSLAPSKGQLYGGKFGGSGDPGKECEITAPATAEAQQWQGWGTTLKPSFEPVVCARKPIAGKNIAHNVLEWGTGGLNIDGCRVETSDELGRLNHKGPYTSNRTVNVANTPPQDSRGRVEGGRWPPNVVFGHHPLCESLGQVAQKGYTINRWSNGAKPFGGGAGNPYEGEEIKVPDRTVYNCHPDCPVALLNQQGGKQQTKQGGVGRFFPQFQQGELDYIPFRYVSKAGKRERNAGLPEGQTSHHPTVKPVSLMRWLCRMVTPPGGIVLDPFAGSGTTGVAALHEGFQSILIELDEDNEYCNIIKARLSYTESIIREDESEPRPRQTSLFPAGEEDVA